MMILRAGVLLAASLVLFSGCVSMQAVKDYSSYSRATIESVNPVAKDFYGSCLRANSYKPFNAHSRCDSEQEASKAILSVASVLDAYGAALGALASDELVDYSADVNKLTDEVTKLKAIDEKKIDAIGKLSTLIANAATSAYQQKEVVKFIQESDESVGTVSDSLADLIETNYAQAISLELSAWEDAYKRVEKGARDATPLEWAAYSKAQWQQRSDLQTKLSATKSLAKSIRAIGQTHHKLKQDAENLTGKEVYASVRTFVDAAKPVIINVQEAFSKE
ncbi:hypothetical protein KKE54_07335 [bacterium]|nr:hypothetical protein [bacterium]